MAKKQGRAANGAGTIRKRSDALWEGRYTGPDGRQRSVYAKTEKAVKARLKAAQAELTLGLWFEPSHITVEAWAREWLKEYTKHIKPTTLYTYTGYMDKHIIPLLGKRKLNQLKPIHIQRAFNKMSETLSVGTLKSIKICLSSCLACAVRFHMIQDNPCANLTLGKVEKQPLVIIDRKDIPAFVNAAKQDSHYGAAMLFLLQTGVRSGEQRGLCWSDVDLEDKTVTIRRQIVKTADGMTVQNTKTGKPRTIVLIDETVELLKAHKVQQAEMRIKAGGWTDTDLTRDLVFRQPNGDCYRPGVLYTAVKKAGLAIGIEGLHPHSLRDSYAVAALRSGVDVKTVQNNLGHADAAMTLNTYATYTDDMGRVGASKFGQYWRENSTN